MATLSFVLLYFFCGDRIFTILQGATCAGPKSVTMPQKVTVFLVDDDIDDQEIFSIMLEDALPEAECVFAKDGIQALEKLQQPAFAPDVIFIDINMPKMNGMEFLAEMRKRPSLLHIPAFMYSTSDEKAIVEQCKSLGASGLIKKHANTDEVKKEIRKIVSTLI